MHESDYDRARREERDAKCREYGLPEGTNFLSFRRMPGAGTVYCKDCGHREHVIGFTHGGYECEIGRQCPQCHTFVVEYHRSKEYHRIGPLTEDCLCPKCGAVVQGKDDDLFKRKDAPLFCPTCHGYNLEYDIEYIT